MEKIEKVFDKAIIKIDQFMHLGDVTLDAFFHVVGAGLKEISLKGNLALKGIHQIYSKHAKTLRYLSFPWSLVILYGYKLLHTNDLENIPLLKEGMHLVRSRVGGGKSLTSLVLAELTLNTTGLPSYFTSPVEKPRLSEDGRYYYVMHRVVNTDDYYRDGKKVKNFNAANRPYFHKDERHLDYNPRMNKGKEYNKKWVVEHEDELLMRHDKFKTIIKYSQHMKLDSQEMETLTYMHEVETKKDIPIKRWLEDGKFNYIPVKLKFHTYAIEYDFEGNHKRKLVKRWALPVPYEVLQIFDTHAEAYKHAGLPMDYN